MTTKKNSTRLARNLSSATDVTEVLKSASLDELLGILSGEKQQQEAGVPRFVQLLKGVASAYKLASARSKAIRLVNLWNRKQLIHRKHSGPFAGLLRVADLTELRGDVAKAKSIRAAVAKRMALQCHD